MIELKKDPGDRLPYGIDYSPWLDTGESITGSDWTVLPDGDLVLEESAVVSGTGTEIWIHGGVDGTPYIVSNTITTNSSPIQKIKVQSFVLLVRAQHVVT